MSGFLALPFPVACIFSFTMLTIDQGNPRRSHVSTAAPSMGNNAFTEENCPE